MRRDAHRVGIVDHRRRARLAGQHPATCSVRSLAAMSVFRSPGLFAILPALAACLGLAACGDRNRGERDALPVRIPLVIASAAIPSGPAISAEPSVWTASPQAHVAEYGQVGGAQLLTIACEGLEQHASRLVIVRFTAADKGAQALFAIQGSRGILRLPVSAVKIGKRGYVWRGVLDAGDPRAEVLLGSGLKATVPAGGELDLPPMGAAGAVVSECVSAAAPAAQGQTVPNLASNPATSPADR